MINPEKNRHHEKCEEQSPGDGIDRRDVLKRTGKYAALTSATLFLVLSPKAEAQVSDPAAPAPW